MSTSPPLDKMSRCNVLLPEATSHFVHRGQPCQLQFDRSEGVSREGRGSNVHTLHHGVDHEGTQEVPACCHTAYLGPLFMAHHWQCQPAKAGRAKREGGREGGGRKEGGGRREEGGKKGGRQAANRDT